MYTEARGGVRLWRLTPHSIIVQ